MNKKNEVRAFYDEIGWKRESDGHFQNARYEDLRPVSAEYIHRCHLRIPKYFEEGGKYLLDIGSGPVQYPEYLTYSEKFDLRVCFDISITALEEARKKIGDRGLYVVGDAANLPFARDVFDGIVSLHTFHHLTLDEQREAWKEVYRTLRSRKNAVIVNGWTESDMMQKWLPAVRFMEFLGNIVAVLRGRKKPMQSERKSEKNKPTGTFIQKMDANWIRSELPQIAPTANITIRCWRSVSVRWLRAIVHKPYGKMLLRRLFNKEEENPQTYGERGQYPMIILSK